MSSPVSSGRSSPPRPGTERLGNKTMAKSISVKDLDIYYGDFLAVQGVTMSIKSRAVTAFIGPSGCGKSTFLRSLNRMHEVITGARVEGDVVVDGQSLYEIGRATFRESVCQYVQISVVAGSLQKKKQRITISVD